MMTIPPPGSVGHAENGPRDFLEEDAIFSGKIPLELVTVTFVSRRKVFGKFSVSQLNVADYREAELLIDLYSIRERLTTKKINDRPRLR